MSYCKKKKKNSNILTLLSTDFKFSGLPYLFTHVLSHTALMHVLIQILA